MERFIVSCGVEKSMQSSRYVLGVGQCSTYEAKRTLSHCMCYYNSGDVDGVPVQGIELLEGFQPSSFDEPAGCRDGTTRWRTF